MLSNDEDGRKLSARSDLLRPVFSILNPELTYTLPDFQTACGAVDMLVHIIERYFTKTSNVDLTDKLCEGAMKSIIKNSKLVLKHPKNYDYRAELMWAGTLAHNGILGTGREEDWASHKIEHELSAVYDIAHGAGLAVVTPAWMKYVYRKDIQRFAMFARNVFDVNENDDSIAAKKGIEELERFFREIGLQTTLKELGINDGNFSEMAKNCADYGGGTVGYFVKLDEKKIIEILKTAMEG